MGQNLSRMACQIHQEIEFLRREMDAATFYEHAPGLQIDVEVSDIDNLFFERVLARCAAKGT